MKLAPILLATSLSANAVDIPQTPELQRAIQNFVASNVAVCNKHELPEELCVKNIENKMSVIVEQVNEICKDYPKDIVACSQYGLEHLMNRDTHLNLIILRSKNA